ncbi:hypothetical protein ACHAXR_002462 [Thalassiosira sp. AJA248-18]
MTLPLEPVLTPCEHVFCKGCINQALDGADTNQCCPNDRAPCTVHQLQPIQGFISRIWSNIQVKCGNHDSGCAWTGSIGDYATHLDNNCVRRVCENNRGGTDAAVWEQVEILEKKNVLLSEELESVKFTKSALEREIVRLEMALLNHRSSVNDELVREIGFNGNYSFKRENVTELSQLISRYLNKPRPREIDTNKIYNCVQCCFRDLENRYSDNPQFYKHDMKMLLATCEASNWFSVRQQENFSRWFQEQF